MNKQYNAISKEEYRGDNQSRLSVAKEENEFTSDAWLTFLQAKQLGLKIKKGSKSQPIFKGFTTKVEIDKKTGKEHEITFPAGSARVFNLDQTEKYDKTASESQSEEVQGVGEESTGEAR